MVLQWSLDHDDERNVCIARDKLKELRARLARNEPSPVTDDDRLWSRFRWPKEQLESISALLAVTPSADLDSPTTVVPGPKATTWLDGTPRRINEKIWRDRIESQRSKTSEPGRSIAANVTAFLALKEGQVRAGELTAGRYTPIKHHLHDSQDWLGPTTDVSVISGKLLTDYHADLLHRIASDETVSKPAFEGNKKKLSADYARDRISAVKTFVRWLYETDVIPETPFNS